MALIDRKCKCCEQHFKAKESDIKRGWAKCCSKSCAAKYRGGWNIARRNIIDSSPRTRAEEFYRASLLHKQTLNDMDDGWDDHKH